MEPLENVLAVHNRPVLTVQASHASIERMVQAQVLRDEFTSRLKKALAHRAVPSHGAGAYLCRVTGRTAKAASKWLNAEAIPGVANMKAIASDLGVRLEWLQFGVGPMLVEQQAEPGGNVADIRYSLRPRSDELVMLDTEIVEGDEPLRPDEVELPYLREVEFAAGSGRTQVIENHGRTMRFSLPRLAKAGVQPENAACATAMGTSMEPTIADGSPIAIDRGCTHVIDGKIYALDHGGMLRIKRLYRMPVSRVRLVSDNSDEHPEETYSLLGDEAPVILGRVFWWEVFD